jgi:hypothetical protein
MKIAEIRSIEEVGKLNRKQVIYEELDSNAIEP